MDTKDVVIVTREYRDYESDVDIRVVLRTMEEAKKYIDNEVEYENSQIKMDRRDLFQWKLHEQTPDTYSCYRKKEFLVATRYKIAVLDEKGHPTDNTCELQGCKQCKKRDSDNPKRVKNNKKQRTGSK